MIKNFLCFLLLIGLFFTVSASAQPELDTTFRSTGKAYLQFATTGMTQDAVVQPDKKILLLGNCLNLNLGNVPFCLIRLNADGAFDTTFGAGQGNSGFVFTKINGFNADRNTTTGIALQNDGKIVVTGSVNSIASHLAIIRYNPDGSLDPSFGTGGIVTAPVNGNALANKVLIQPDGKIVVVGNSGSAFEFRQFVTRYLPNGAPDGSFGTGGVVSIDFQSVFTTGLAVALQPDGKILTGGATSNAPQGPDPRTAFLVTRLNANGLLDTSFDGDGFKNIVSETNIYPDRGIVALAVQSDGQILALGNTNFLYRFNPDGSPDTSFDNDGARRLKRKRRCVRPRRHSRRQDLGRRLAGHFDGFSEYLLPRRPLSSERRARYEFQRRRFFGYRHPGTPGRRDRRGARSAGQTCHRRALGIRLDLECPVDDAAFFSRAPAVAAFAKRRMYRTRDRFRRPAGRGRRPHADQGFRDNRLQPHESFRLFPVRERAVKSNLYTLNLFQRFELL
jgi:uncharacterized delta-60 repeat protein